MLRASTASSGIEINLDAINDGTSETGIAFEHELVAFAEAMVGSDDATLARTRTALVDAMGAAAMVDAAGVASNFERMVRIADATGIPLGEGLETVSSGIRSGLDLDRFQTE
jgi:hypothetical protein